MLEIKKIKQVTNEVNGQYQELAGRQLFPKYEVLTNDGTDPFQ